MTQADEEARRRAEQARQVGLFRYRLISEVTGPQLSARQRGQRVRELAAREHDGPPAPRSTCQSRPSGGGCGGGARAGSRRWCHPRPG